jgi:hypothetical protein
MTKRRIVLIGAGVFVSAGLALAQPAAAPDPAASTTTAAAPPPAPPASTSPFTHWGTDFSFLFDGYVDKNFNNPPSGFNQLRAFDVRSNTAHVSMAIFTIDHAPAPVGFHVDVGFGQTFSIIHAGNRDPEAWKYFNQAYVSFKPKSWHGIEIDAGEFVTSAGAEVIPTNQNWNYSRSLLFTWAIPFAHFGIRTTFPVGQHFTGGFQLVNGWNNVEPINSGKTFGFTGAYAWKKVTWANNYYVGPEHTGTTAGWRNLYDTVVTVNASDKLSYYVNFDLGHDKNAGPGAANWTGIAGAARYAIGKRYAIASRLEWFDDMDGFSTGTPQQLKEVTVTGEYKISGWLLTRLEFRNDWSNQPYFQTNNGTSKTQPTVTLGLIAFLGPKR